MRLIGTEDLASFVRISNINFAISSYKSAINVSNARSNLRCIVISETINMAYTSFDLRDA